jgi:hypothetical protein
MGRQWNSQSEPGFSAIGLGLQLGDQGIMQPCTTTDPVPLLDLIKMLTVGTLWMHALGGTYRY